MSRLSRDGKCESLLTRSDTASECLMLCLFGSKFKKKKFMLGVGTPLQSQLLGGRGRRISVFMASLVYRVSSRTARATQRNLVSKKEKVILNMHPCQGMRESDTVQELVSFLHCVGPRNRTQIFRLARRHFQC